ncbi:hypothetical protein DLM_0609 [Aquitalea magnusonii]|uniref:Uncharacterized protein n=1 Tax=Aquitalea magnusonii TaxID=332411 RepID=A0A3G9GDT5_9NEIS|nr:hypothetical protein DLM_0609 [Aquitalea magnusonii]
MAGRGFIQTHAHLLYCVPGAFRRVVLCRGACSCWQITLLRCAKWRCGPFGCG